MRVTQRTLEDHWVSNLQNRLQTMDQLNRQIGSGVRVQKPADDPSGASRLVRIEEVVARNEQYLKNIEESLAVNRSTDSALGQVYQHVVRAKSLAVEGSNDASVPLAGGFSALADEVAGIKAGVLQLALSRYQEKYLFSGTAGEKPPFGIDGGPYQGDSNRLRVNTGNAQTVPVNLPGDFAFRESKAASGAPLPDSITIATPLRFVASDGTVDVAVTLPPAPATAPVTYAADALVAAIEQQLSDAGANLEARREPDGTLAIAIADTLRGGEITLSDDASSPGALGAVLGVRLGTQNIFGVLDDLNAALESQDTRQVEKMLGRIDRALDSLASERGLVGARARNLEFARDRLQAYNATSETLKADIEGVDLPKAVMRISGEEQAYQTALAAGARIFNVSIIDFLR